MELERRKKIFWRLLIAKATACNFEINARQNYSSDVKHAADRVLKRKSLIPETEVATGTKPYS